MSTTSVRVTLLVLAIVMFATVWSNDHKPGPARLRMDVAYVLPAACTVEMIEPVSHDVLEAAAEREFVSEQSLLIETAASEVATELLEPLAAEKPSAIEVSGLEFPLPAGLATGEYRIIDRFGNIETLSVTREALIFWGITGQNLPCNAYEVSVGENRWHFIRIDQPVVSAPTQAEVAQAWRSVFRFADRKMSPAIQQASGPLKRWWGGSLNLSGDSRELR